MTRCYLMSEEHFDTIDRKLYKIRCLVEGMRKSERRTELLDAIHIARGYLHYHEDIFGGEDE